MWLLKKPHVATEWPQFATLLPAPYEASAPSGLPPSQQQALIKHVYKNEEEFFMEESNGAYSGLLEELEQQPQILNVTKQGFNIWASL